MGLISDLQRIVPLLEFFAKVIGILSALGLLYLGIDMFKNDVEKFLKKFIK